MMREHLGMVNRDRMERRLAAILAADVAGYSVLMAADHDSTLAELRRLRAEVFGPAMAGLRGRVVKSMGDGWLVEFASAADAASAALFVQDELTARGGLKLRIGVHVGDVTHADEDLFGDGVNVAARLEAICEPGGVVISDPVWSSLDGTLRPSFDDGGERTLKNIVRPLRVWTRAARREGGAEAAAPSARKGFPRLALAPVATTDERAEVRELAESVTADLGLYFGSIRWLEVETRERAPGGAYALSATLRSRGEQFRLEARMAGPDERPLWSGKFDGALEDAFDWQDKVGEEIVASVSAILLQEETAKLAALPCEGLRAEQHLLAGLMAYRFFKQEGYAAALGHFSAAIDAEPALAEPYAEAIMAVVSGRTVGFSGWFDQYVARLPGWVAAARALAGRSPLLDLSIAIDDFMQTGALAPLRATANDALRRAPFDTQVLCWAGWGFIWCGAPEDALKCFERHRRLGRFSPYAVAVFGGFATASLQCGDDEAAIRYADAGLELTDGYPSLFAAKAAALAWLGRQAEAEAAMERYRALNPARTIGSWKAVNDYGGSPGGARYFEGMRRAGLPD